jgi:hypothetical protein
MALAILIVAILAISIIDKLFKYFGYRYRSAACPTWWTN